MLYFNHIATEGAPDNYNSDFVLSEDVLWLISCSLIRPNSFTIKKETKTKKKWRQERGHGEYFEYESPSRTCEREFAYTRTLLAVDQRSSAYRAAKWRTGIVREEAFGVTRRDRYGATFPHDLGPGTCFGDGDRSSHVHCLVVNLSRNTVDKADMQARITALVESTSAVLHSIRDIHKMFLSSIKLALIFIHFHIP